MAWFIIESLAFIIVAFLLGLLVGWLIWGRRSTRSDEAASAPTSAAADGSTAAAADRPEKAPAKTSEKAPAQKALEQKTELVAVGSAVESDANHLTGGPSAADRDAALEAELAADAAMVAETQPVAAVTEPEAGSSEAAPVDAAAAGDVAGDVAEAEAEAAEASAPEAAGVVARPAAKGAAKAAASAARQGTPDDPELDEAAAAEVVAEAEAVARQAAEAAAAGEAAAEPVATEPAAAEPEAAAEPVAAEAEVAAEPAEPAVAAAIAAAPEPQDLRRIEGIGPKIDAALKAAGYTTYAKVAAASEAELRAAIKASGIKFAPAASSWAAQAEYLAAGDEDGLKEYQDYLVAGQERTGKFNAKVDYADVDQIEDEAAKAAAIAQDEAEAAALAAAQPEPEPEPEPQDLQRIEGIGPKIEAALKAAGLTTYARVAGASEARLREAIQAAGITFAPAASSWSDQAQYLVDDDEDGLKEYQEYLVAGQDRAVTFHEKVDYADVDQIEDDAAKAAAIAQDEAETAAVEATSAPAGTEPESEVKA
ncbi:helix-hairpin-helix domain-containing protein [Antribacter gilvus]|uniref:helix-hairpin-helix domain-containing protein n=1 Tax=Antribacter gilvus TaxID=2304675 RepID=UPI000F7A9567|nr:helix-hairpin-helix domain-containing protein [Antribacter gilvus]